MQTHRELVVEPVGLNVEALARPIDWGALYGNDHPVEMEIGIGKGTFISAAARAHPEINFFGIEWANWFWRYASDRLRRHNCLNARTVRAEAAYFVREFVPDNSLAALHIYHPDPWPKKRHHKRRLLQEPFLREIERILAPGTGRLQVATDHAGYFEQIEALLKSSKRLRLSEFVRSVGAAEGESVGTNFERKYLREGKPPSYVIAAVKDQ